MDGLSATRFVVTSVPWDNTYRHAYWFGGANSGSGTTARRNAYFEALPKAVDVSDFNFVKFGMGYVDVQRSWNVLRQHNYIWWINSSGGASGNRPFYAFITEMVVMNTRVTRIYYEIDVIQSFGVNLQFRQSHIEQAHVTNRNFEYRNREYQGLNIGEDYLVEHSRAISGNLRLFVFVTKSPIRLGVQINDTINFSGLPDSLTYYAIPFRAGSNVAVNYNNRDFSSQTVNNFMRQYIDNETQLAVELANNIVNMYVVPISQSMLNSLQGSITSPALPWDQRHLLTSFIRLRANPSVAERLNIRRINPNYPAEHPFQVYPFYKYVITDNNGGVIELKPELFNSRTVHEIEWRVTLGPTPTSTIIPLNYGGMASSTAISGTVGRGIPDNRRALALQHGLISQTQNDINFSTDMLAAFIQGNKNQLKAQQATNSENLHYVQGRRDFNYNQARRGLMIDGLRNVQSAINGGFDVGQGALQMKFTAGMAGGDTLRNGLNSLATTALNEFQRQTDRQTLTGNNEISQARELEEYAQKARAIASQKADIANLPNNATVSHNNLYLMEQLNVLGFTCQYMRPRQWFLDRAESYFHYYGMIINHFGTPNLTARPHWTYMKFSQCNVTGDVPEIYLRQIRNIFETGITLWRSDMYNYNRGNR